MIALVYWKSNTDSYLHNFVFYWPTGLILNAEILVVSNFCASCFAFLLIIKMKIMLDPTTQFNWNKLCLKLMFSKSFFQFKPHLLLWETIQIVIPPLITSEHWQAYIPQVQTLHRDIKLLTAKHQGGQQPACSLLHTAFHADHGWFDHQF